MLRALRHLRLILLVVVTCTPVHAAVFLRANASWYDGSVYQVDRVGSLYMGGFGLSGELGVGLSDRVACSLEFAPSYRQPPRKIPSASGLGVGAFQLAAANLTIRMQPIEDVEPFLLVGVGQGVFTFDYGDTGRVFLLGGVERRLTQEKLKTWLIGLGFGFEVPLSSRFSWGLRGRYLYHRWQASTDMGRFLPFSNGNGCTIEGNLKFQF